MGDLRARLGHSFFFIALVVSFSRAQAKCEIEIAYANGENVFDSIKNSRLEDWSYRREATIEAAEEAALINKKRKPPKTLNWTPELADKKIAAIIRLIDQLKRPNIQAGVEFENENVAHKIATALGYNTILMTTGNDPRGINNVVFIREDENLEVIAVNRIDMIGSEFAGHPTRQILEVHVIIDKKHHLVLFVNHWPSQRGPTSARYAAAEILRRRVHAVNEDLPEAHVLATGDFNTIEEEKDPTRHPFTHSLLNPDKLGHLYDVQDALRVKEGLPPGTYYYIPRGRKAAPSWNRLDRFLVSKGLLGRGGLHIDRESYEIVIVEESSQTIETEGGKIIIPKGFDPMTGEGVTDHFPIRMRLRSR